MKLKRLKYARMILVFVDKGVLFSSKYLILVVYSVESEIPSLLLSFSTALIEVSQFSSTSFVYERVICINWICTNINTQKMNWVNLLYPHLVY